MIMFLGIPYLESYIHKGMKTLDSLPAKICARSKTQTIKPALQPFTCRQQVSNAPVLVCSARCDHTP